MPAGRFKVGAAASAVAVFILGALVRVVFFFYVPHHETPCDLKGGLWVHAIIRFIVMVYCGGGERGRVRGMGVVSVVRALDTVSVHPRPSFPGKDGL